MQNNKKTIYFSSYDDIKNPHYGGGGAMAVHEVAKRLAKEYTVRVLSWDYCGKKNESIDGVSYERFGLPFLNPKISMFCYQLALPFIAQSKEFDLWYESFCPPFTVSFLPVFIKKPVVGIVHMLAAEDMERKYKLPFHLIQNHGLKKYKQIIVTSETMKKKVASLTPQSIITTISNGIEKVYPPQIKKEKYLLFLGRIEIDQKGIDLLISAFKIFHRNNPDYQLVIAGSGDSAEIARLKELIKQASLEKAIILKGRVSGKTKESLLCNASCVVIASRFETYSLIALEAMAHNAPLVCFTIEGLSWIPKKAAIRVAPFDVAKLASAFESVILQSEETKAMIQVGNNYAKEFTWDAIAKLYTKYTKNILT